MQDEPNGFRVTDLSTARQDQRIQRSVLVKVISLYPVVTTVAELVRQLTARPDHFGERDAVERAVLDLAGIGLLHRHDFRNRPDALVAPTHAAIVAGELLAGEGADDE